MSNLINIPVQLRPLTGGREHIKIETRNTAPGADDQRATLGRLIDFLEIEAPGVKSRILDQEGKLRQHVSIFVDGKDCRILREKQLKESVVGLGRPLDIPGFEPNPNPLDLRLEGHEEITILPTLATKQTP